MYSHDQTYAYRKFCVGQYAWVDWPSKSFAGKDQDRQARRILVGRLDKKHLPLYIPLYIYSDSDADFTHDHLCIMYKKIINSLFLSLINIKIIYI